MGDMNLSQYQTAVLRCLDNLRSTNTAVAAGDHTACINKAPNILIRMFPDRFPEHHDRSWTQGPTSVGTNRIDLPSNLIVLEKVRHSDGATITNGDWSSVREVIVSPCTTPDLGLLEKDTSVSGYPSLYDRKATDLLYWPTTRAGFATTFRFYGISGEEPLTAASDTFRMHADFDQAIVFMAASRLARILGYTDRADELETSAKREVGEGLGAVSYERNAMYIEPIWNFWRAD